MDSLFLRMRENWATDKTCCHWCVKSDPCGLFCANLSILLILFGAYALFHAVLVPKYGICSMHVVVFTLLSFLNIVCHLKTQYSDPGTIPLSWTTSQLFPKGDSLELSINSTRELQEGEIPLLEINLSRTKPKVCMKCLTIKPRRVHHCSTCSRCIVNMDHHCPWVNNCVGMYNQKYFLLFLFYTALSSIMCGYYLLSRYFECSGNERRRICAMTPSQMLLGVINFAQALLFGLFTIIMIFDQLHAILDNTSYIDNLKGVRSVKKAKMQMLEQVFGEPLSWRWLFPFDNQHRFHIELKRIRDDYVSSIISGMEDDSNQKDV